MTRFLTLAVVALMVSVVAVSAKKEEKGPKGLCTKGKCEYISGSFDFWEIPEYGTCNSGSPSSSTLPYCAGGAINAKACCNKCGNTTASASGAAFNCRYWVHIPAASSTSKCQGAECGKCILLPAVDGIVPVKGGGKKIRIGKSCPYTKDDPHFLGAHGTRFEFNGLPNKSFCLFTDRQVQVNMAMRGYFDSRTEGAALVVNGKAVRTWIRQLAVMWHASNGVKHTFVLTARDGKDQARGDGFLASAALDGKALPTMQIGESRKMVGGIVFTFIGVQKVGPFEADAYTVKVGDLLELDLQLRVAHPLLQTPDDAQTHINVMFNDVAPTADVHGVMGQTYRSGREKKTIDFSRLAAVLHTPVSADGETGKGFLDGKTSDYETSSVTATDCRFTVFNGGELPSSA